MSASTTRKRTDAGEALAQRLGRSIAKHRNAQGVTQEELSERLVVDPKSLARIERGAVLPSLQRVFELSEALRVPVAQLLGEASPREEDLADWLSKRLRDLSEDDRARILDLVDRLAK